MTYQSNDPHADSPTRSTTRTRISNLIKIVVGFVIALFLIIFVVNQLTPVPFVFLFRQFLAGQETEVKIGPYAEQITTIAERSVEIPVDGVPNAVLTIYTPEEPADVPRPLVLFIHGGGWVVGTARSVGPFAKLIASEGYVVASLDYSLAPEYTYPTPILQSAAAIDYLAEHAGEYGADPTQLFIGGNSAGAQISSQLGAMMTNPAFENEVGIPIQMPGENLRGIILYSGPYDFDTAERTNFPGWRMYVWSYTGERDYARYPRFDEFSTVRHVTADYPPTYMTTGDGDPFEPQTYEFDAILRALGVDVTSRYWTGSGLNLPHDYVYDLNTEGAQTALEDVLQFLRDKSQL